MNTIITKRHPRSPYWRILFATVITSLFLTPALSAQEGFTVTAIQFEGNQAFTDYRLSQITELRESGFLPGIFGGKEPALFSVSTFEADQIRVKRFYQSNGFLKAQVTTGKLVIDPKARTVKVAFLVNEGPPILVEKVTSHFAGSDQALNASLTEWADPDKDHLALRRETRFSDEQIVSDKGGISSFLRNLGHPFARVSWELAVDESRDRVDITWNVDPGPACLFGDVTIEGNKFIASKQIMRQLTFHAGDQYEGEQLARSQQQVYDLESFDIVTVTADLADSSDSNIDVTVKVRESSRYVTKVGFGYGREDEFRVFAGVGVRGVLNDITRLDFYTKHSAIIPYDFELVLTRPSFLTPRTTATVQPAIIKQKEPSFSIIRSQVAFGLEHKFTQNLTGITVFKYERLDLDLGSLSDLIVDDAELRQLLDIYNRGSIRLELDWDRSTPRKNPRGGFFVGMSETFSGIIFKSVARYNKSIIEVRKYLPVRQYVVAGRVKLGDIVSYGTVDFVPPDDRLYSGGAGSVRGWGRSELGPVDDEGIPIGGNSLLEIGLEFRYPILGALSGVIFTDEGNVWVESHTYRLDELRYSAGFGFRYATAFGSIGTDFARPVDDEVDTWQFHLNFGATF